MMTKLGESKGFTLIETLVTLVIVSVAISALGTLLISTIKTNRASESGMDAAAIASNIFSNYSAQIIGGAGIPANVNGAVYDGNVTYDLYTLSVTKAGPSKEVVLTVTLHHPGMTKDYISQMVVMAP